MKYSLLAAAALALSVSSFAATTCIVSGVADNPSHSCPSDGTSLVTGVNGTPCVFASGLDARYKTSAKTTSFIDCLFELWGALLFIR